MLGLCILFTKLGKTALFAGSRHPINQWESLTNTPICCSLSHPMRTPNDLWLIEKWPCFIGTNHPSSYINNGTITHFHPRHMLCIITLLINPRQFRGQVLLLPIFLTALHARHSANRGSCSVSHRQAPESQPRAHSTPDTLSVDGEALGTSTPLLISEVVELPQGRENLGSADILQACLMDRVNSGFPRVGK